MSERAAMPGDGDAGVDARAAERASTVAALATAVARYRALAECTRDVLCLTDADGTVTYVGPQCLSYGRRPDEFEGRHLLEIVAPEDRAHVEGALARIAAGGEVAPPRFHIHGEDGQTLWFEATVHVQRDPSGGAVTGFVGALRDITPRMQAERTGRESEERYRRLFAAMSDALLVFDAETRRILDVNAAACALYGYPRDELLGLAQGELTAEPQATDESVRRTLAEGALRIPLRWHRTKDGTPFPVEIATGAFLLEGRQAVCGIVRDISERLEAERVREEQAERLRRLAARLASAQDEEQRRIAEGLHDDVAQLLTAASVRLSAARGAPDPSQAAPLLATAEELLGQANERVRDLSFELASSTLRRLGLPAGLEDLCERMQARLGVRYTFRTDGGRVALDEATTTVLFKCVRELLFNVAKHAHVREAEVTLGRDGEELVIVVEDRGRGFPPEASGDGGRTGEGLGLFGIRERLRDLGGRLAIDSEPGVRTRVTLRAPLPRETRARRRRRGAPRTS